MFDNNKKISVGRDININLKNSNIEDMSTDELIEERTNSKIILDKEFSRKMKTIPSYIIFALVIFIFIFFFIPLLLNSYMDKDNLIVKLATDKETLGMFSLIGSILAIINSLLKLRETNEIEKKHKERIIMINTILQEREYLDKY